MKGKQVKHRLSCILALLLGCVPLALADGAAAVSCAVQETYRQRNFETKFDRKEQKRLAKLEKKRWKEEKKQRAREEKQQRKEQKRLAKQEKKRFKEERKFRVATMARQGEQETEQPPFECQEETQKPLAAVEKRRLEERERNRLEELDRQRQADDRHAQELLNDISTALSSARWSKEQLSEWVKSASAIDRSMASKSTLGRVHMGLGLYAYFCDEKDLAQKEWSLAKKWGAKNPRAIADEVWTPGALEIFLGS